MLNFFMNIGNNIESRKIGTITGLGKHPQVLVIISFGPTEFRTPVSGVRGQRPRPLDDGTLQ